MLDYHYNYGKGNSESFTAYYVSAGGGASLQWFFFKPFFLEFGLEYNHIFTIHDHPHQGYIRPMIGAGLQF
ncbi:hypothetical protein FACS189447_09980 [Spirochaetia bacterium]|nr:hypothetical protein FACS189447_09980 [Spirochaetia bacterium]